MRGPVHRVVRPDPPRPVWRSFQPGGWIATEVYEWRLYDDGGWAEVHIAENGLAPGRTWVAAQDLRRRDPIRLGRAHRCDDPP